MSDTSRNKKSDGEPRVRVAPPPRSDPRVKVVAAASAVVEASSSSAMRLSALDVDSEAGARLRILARFYGAMAARAHLDVGYRDLPGDSTQPGAAGKGAAK